MGDPLTVQDIIVILSSLVIVAAALRITHRVIPHHRREPSNDVAGFIFAAVGVLYAVPLAFVVIAVWTNNDTAKTTTFQEANELAGIYWESRELPLPLGSQLEHDTLAYAHTVIDEEWPLLAHHQTSPTATQLVYDIRNTAFGFQPQNAQQQVMFDHLVTHVDNLAEQRRARINQAGDSVPGLLWVVLIVGGVLTVAFTFLFGLYSSLAHTLMVLILAGLVVVSLLVVKEMSYPFSGTTRVGPEAFDVFLSRLPAPR
jgi:hypothetical protein